MGGSDKKIYEEEEGNKERGSGKVKGCVGRRTVRAAGGAVWLSFDGAVWMSFGGSGFMSFRGGGRKPPATARSMHRDDSEEEVRRKEVFGERSRRVLCRR